MTGSHFFVGLTSSLLLLSHPVSVFGHQGSRTLTFPEPPHRLAVGTEAGPIRTFVRRVTIANADPVQRFGLLYLEMRGEIEGVGWGGQNAAGAFLQAHYSYRFPYVLRVPIGWDGTLVVHRHGTGPFGLWQLLEANLGDRNFARTFHETADRFVSDVALHPSRRWAFFSVNQTPIDPGGAFNTLLLPAPGDPPAAASPVHSMLDVPVARDTAMLAKRLLKTLYGREPRITLGTGHSGGALVNLMLNAGVDHVRTGGPLVLAGDNFVRPYDPSSARIFDGFIWFSGGGGPIVPIDVARGVSAPTLFFAGEVDGQGLLAMRQVDEMIGKGVDVANSARIYMARNVPHIDSDLVSAINVNGRDFAGLLGLPQEFYEGGGERLKGLSGAMLDALRDWIKKGVAPPPSMLNGMAENRDNLPGLDAVAFSRSDGQVSLAYPYVDRPDLDRIVAGNITSTQNNVPLAMAWERVRSHLGARTESIVLSETACRRGMSSFISDGPVGTWFVPFDESRFLNTWGTSAAYQACRTGAVDRLVTGGLYDPAVVSIDIHPDRSPNILDWQSAAWVPVAILSTAGFDAARIVPETVRLAGSSQQGRAPHPGRMRAHRKDVNGDGRIDLVVEFQAKKLQFAPNDVVADLWGWTRDLSPFSGSDIVTQAR